MSRAKKHPTRDHYTVGEARAIFDATTCDFHESDLDRWSVERVEVASTPVLSFDFDSAAALRDWFRVDLPEVRGAIVRIRCRTLPGEESLLPADVRAALLQDDGVLAAHVAVEPAPQPRQERVEGISRLPNSRQRMARYLESVYPSTWTDEGGTLHPVAVEVLRVMGEEGL